MSPLRQPPRAEWLAIVGYLTLIVAFEGIAIAQNPGAPPIATIAAGQVVRYVAWLAVLPMTWYTLDSLPFQRGRILRNLSIIVVTGVVSGAIQGLISAVGAHLASYLMTMPSDMVGPGTLAGEINRGAGQFPVFLFAPHLVARAVRAAARRRTQKAESDRSLARAELHALSVEMQPHFLFNTLNAIAGLVRSDPRTAETMLIKLSDLLRLTLDGQDEGESSLGDEIERLDLYIALQQMRFGTRLQVSVSVPDDIRGAGVPSMLLQPLVENSIAHGIGPKPGPGSIAITGRREGGRLLLAVEDDGVGLPEDARSRERIGVGNTRARLARLFPGDHRFELAPVATGGARATIDIPFHPVNGHARADR